MEPNSEKQYIKLIILLFI